MSKGQRVGYVRVSSVDQNEVRQLDGVELDRTFTDKASGKDTQRPELQKLLMHVREGDVVIVHSMDRLARNIDDLRRIVKELTDKGVQVQFVKESLTFTGDDSPMANLLLSMLGAVAQFERELIKERQREGIAIAKKAGAFKGRKRTVTDTMVRQMRDSIAKGAKKSVVAAEYGISRETLYQYIRDAV